jgi:hypothetical protein
MDDAAAGQAAISSRSMVDVVHRVVTAPIPFWLIWMWWAAVSAFLLDWRLRARVEDGPELATRRGAGTLIGIALVLAMALYFLGVVDQPLLWAR